jgi:hypothetical protein
LEIFGVKDEEMLKKYLKSSRSKDASSLEASNQPYCDSSFKPSSSSLDKEI